jgi:competence protein ComEC
LPGFFCFIQFGGKTINRLEYIWLVLAMEIFRFPLVRVALFFVAGIIWADCSKPDAALMLTVTVMCVLALAISFVWARQRPKSRIYFGVFLSLAALCCGAITQTTHCYYNQRGHYFSENLNNGKHAVCFTIESRLKNSAAGARYIANINAIDNKPSNGKILIHFRRKEHLRVGTILIADGQIVANAKPRNPDQFDYGKYLNNKSIPAQLYVQPDNYLIVGTKKGVAYYADRFRDKLISSLRQDGFNERELQVLHALILGQQQEISPDIVKDYQFAGAVHILSVSGLHVGFVLLFINFVLHPLPRTRRWNFVRLCLILFSLWTFALVAGLSPSVVRSATMFSFVAIGMSLRRSTNTFHTLIVSLLLILLFSPAFLFDVGFQLSYAALFFIVWLQPLFNSLWQPKWRVIKYFWEIITVSFAAQLGTLPLSLYYFHQFPALFFVTNLVVIPMLSVIMAVGIIVMLPAAFGYVFPFLSDLLESGIVLLNQIIGKIASFETFVFIDIPYNAPMLVTGYASIIAIMAWCKTRGVRKLILATGAIFIFQLAVLGSVWWNRQQSEWLVLHVSRKTTIVARYGDVVTVFGEFRPACRNYTTAHFAYVKKTLPINNTFWFARKTILLVDRAPIPESLKPQILVLSHSPKINLDRVLKNSRPEVVVADASNYKTDVARWKATCQKQKIPFHDTREKGFFKLSD